MWMQTSNPSYRVPHEPLTVLLLLVSVKKAMKLGEFKVALEDRLNVKI
jgi:hypothetical protein